MSQENVEVVRGIYAEWAQGHMRAGVEVLDSDVDFRSFMPDANDWVFARGPEEVEAFMREFLAQWTDYKLIGEEFRDTGPGVFVAGRQAARGKQSGAAVEDPMHSVWAFRADRVTALTFTPRRPDALRAAGLSE